MKLSLQFPSIVYAAGHEAVARIAQAAETIGFDQVDLFDHVVMGHAMEGRDPGPYPTQMPILEPLVALGFLAAVTRRIGLGTEVLILPQRQPALVAKQISTLDTLSGGRMRVGLGVGWQECEYEALGTDFHQRGSMLDEAIPLLRAYWSQESIDFEGAHFKATRLAMEPKPPQGAGIPLWIGGDSRPALRRAGTLGDGWMANGAITDRDIQAIASVRQHAERAGRDPEKLGFQAQITAPYDPDDLAGRSFHSSPDRIAAVVAGARQAGFGWAAINASYVYLAGAQTPDAFVEDLERIHERVRAEVGRE
jgi:probable F420-dependent oxidoreductase